MPDYNCKKCKKINIFIQEIVISQEKLAKKRLEEKKLSEDNWFCQKCKTLNKMPKYKCSKCFEINYNIFEIVNSESKTSNNFIICSKCNTKNKKNLKKCSNCKNNLTIITMNLGSSINSSISKKSTMDTRASTKISVNSGSSGSTGKTNISNITNINNETSSDINKCTNCNLINLPGKINCIKCKGELKQIIAKKKESDDDLCILCNQTLGTNLVCYFCKNENKKKEKSSSSNVLNSVKFDNSKKLVEEDLKYNNDNNEKDKDKNKDKDTKNISKFPIKSSYQIATRSSIKK